MTKTSRGLLVGSACDRAGGGTSGTTPTPSSARPCLLLTGVARAFGAQAGGQLPARGLRRNFGTRGERRGSADRSACSASLGAASLSCAPGKSVPSLGGARGTPGLILRWPPAGTRLNKATCCTDRALLGRPFRKNDKRGRLMLGELGAASGTRPCKWSRSTCGGWEIPAVLRGTGCSGAGGFS